MEKEAAKDVGNFPESLQARVFQGEIGQIEKQAAVNEHHVTSNQQHNDKQNEEQTSSVTGGCTVSTNPKTDYLFNSDTSVNAQLQNQFKSMNTNDRATLIAIACRYGHLHTVQALLQCLQRMGIDVKPVLHTSDRRHFPLFVAASGRIHATRVLIINALIEAKANVNHTTSGNCTALWKASNEGYVDTVIALLAHKADVTIYQKATNISPLYNACYRGHDDIVEILINAKADIFAKRKQTGASPFYTSAENGHGHIIRQLLRGKAKVNDVTKKSGSSPLYIASQNGRLSIVHLLVQAKADMSISRTADQCTPLYAAADKGFCEILQYLHLAKANVNMRTKDGIWNPLRIAAHRDFENAVHTIIDMKADVDAIILAKKSASHAIKRHLETALDLIAPKTK